MYSCSLCYNLIQSKTIIQKLTVYTSITMKTHRSTTSRYIIDNKSTNELKLRTMTRITSGTIYERHVK